MSVDCCTTTNALVNCLMAQSSANKCISRRTTVNGHFTASALTAPNILLPSSERRGKKARNHFVSLSHEIGTRPGDSDDMTLSAKAAGFRVLRSQRVTHEKPWS